MQPSFLCPLQMPEAPLVSRLFSEFWKIFIDIFSRGELNQNSINNCHQFLIFGVKNFSDMLQQRKFFCHKFPGGAL